MTRARRCVLRAPSLVSAVSLPAAVATGALLTLGSIALVAQSGLAQLGLTETAARTFVLDDIKSPAASRGSGIAVAGTRAFLKLPAAARGPAATALFAWAKAYVGSPAFKTAYATHRRGVIGPDDRPSPPSVDDELQKLIEEAKAGIAQARAIAAALPPADAANMLKLVAEQEAKLASGETAKLLRPGLEAQHAERTTRDAANAKRDDEQYPADPSRIVARRLREFLTATADVNFSARTLSLTGGPDGIEFLDKADRQRHWIWQLAAIVGPEATSAARAAADAWLKEIEP
jgi:hypothetical protein